MADINTDPFGEHEPFGPGVVEQPDESRPDEMGGGGVKVFL